MIYRYVLIFFNSNIYVRAHVRLNFIIIYLALKYVIWLFRYFMFATYTFNSSNIFYKYLNARKQI